MGWEAKSRREERISLTPTARKQSQVDIWRKAASPHFSPRGRGFGLAVGWASRAAEFRAGGPGRPQLS